MQQNVNKEHSLDCPARLEGDIHDKNRIQGQPEWTGEATAHDQAFL